MPDPKAEPIRLLTIITKLELGGAQQVVLHTMSRLPAARYRLYLISGAHGLLDETARSLKHCEVHLWPGLKHPIAPWHDVAVFFRLVRFLREHRIQIVHTHSSKAGMLGRLAAAWAGVPVVFHTVHGWPFHDYQPALVRGIFIWLERLAARHTTRLIAVSHPTRQKGLQYGIGRPQQYQDIFPGSDLSLFKPGNRRVRAAVRREFGFPQEALLVGMVACLKPQKAPLDFVRAAGLIAQALPPARFLMVGDGQLRPAVEKKIAALGLGDKIKLAGWRKDVPRLMQGFDLFALSSLWEGLPCVLAQAFAAGLPVVATDVEGAREIIAPGRTGLLVPPADPAALAQACIKLLQNPAQRQRMARAARPEAKKFDVQPMVDQLHALYQTIGRKI